MMKQLRKGYTTGTCATAASLAAVKAILTGQSPSRVTVGLPSGREAGFDVVFCRISGGSAECAVRKDAGDDPDVTNGLMIHSLVTLCPEISPGTVLFLQGSGVGRVTLPGLEIPVGEPAINPVPRRMIAEHIAWELEQHGLQCGAEVTVSVPGGDRVAEKTMNARVGILDGLSILGTTGVVVPYSREAYLASIDQAIRLASANGCRELAVTSGGRSESQLRALYPSLSAPGAIHYGNYIGSTLDMISAHGGFRNVIVGVMLAKATKLIMGEADLSSRTVPVRPLDIAALAASEGYGSEICSRIAGLHLVRNMTEIVPFSRDEPLYRRIALLSWRACRKFLHDMDVTVALLGRSGDAVICHNSEIE